MRHIAMFVWVFFKYILLAGADLAVVKGGTKLLVPLPTNNKCCEISILCYHMIPLASTLHPLFRIGYGPDRVSADSVTQGQVLKLKKWGLQYMCMFKLSYLTVMEYLGYSNM